MKFELDFRSGIPIYSQIVEQVKRLIASGKLRQGDQLPTVRALAQELRVNFNTIARAYRLLDEAGIISTQQGRGTYILEAPSAEASEQLKRQTLEGLSRRYLADAIRLGCSAEEALEIMKAQVSQWEEKGNLPDSEEIK
jgi:GntR family transcriptional regulator